MSSSFQVHFTLKTRIMSLGRGLLSNWRKSAGLGGWLKNVHTHVLRCEHILCSVRRVESSNSCIRLCTQDTVNPQKHSCRKINQCPWEWMPRSARRSGFCSLRLMRNFRCQPQFWLSERIFLQYYDSYSSPTCTQEIKKLSWGERSDNAWKFKFGLLQEIWWFLFCLNLPAFPLLSPLQLEQNETLTKLKLVISYPLYST